MELDQFNTYYIAVGCLIIIDILSGLIKALVTGTMDSGALRRGLYHKATYVLIIAMATVLEVAGESADLGFSIPLVPFSSYYIIGTEVVSILENVCEANPELKMSKLLGIFNSNKIGGTEDDGTGRTDSTGDGRNA